MLTTNAFCVCERTEPGTFDLLRLFFLPVFWVAKERRKKNPKREEAWEVHT
jgi:hypothetical protein